jgi:AcrR family transcriptional regulator
VDASTPKAALGRKRSADSRRAILDAAVRIVGADGYAGLSTERIARESGTGKQTIYRWWPTKADVVMEALLEKVELKVPEPKTRDLRLDLTAFLQDSFALGRSPKILDLLRGLAAEAQLDAAFAERFRATFVANRRAALTTILERRAGAPASSVRITTLLDVVFGVIWYRLLIAPAEFDQELVDELVVLVAGAR